MSLGLSSYENLLCDASFEYLRPNACGASITASSRRTGKNNAVLSEELQLLLQLLEIPTSSPNMPANSDGRPAQRGSSIDC